MVALSFCIKSLLPPPIVDRSNAQFLLRALVADRLLTSTEASRILQSLVLLKAEQFSLEHVEGVAPADCYLTIRWLRGFFAENNTEQPDRIPLVAELPHASVAAALLNLKNFNVKLVNPVFEIPATAHAKLLQAVSIVCETFGVHPVIQHSEDPPAQPLWRAPRKINLLGTTFGACAVRAREILEEVFESGGAMPSRALLDLLKAEERQTLAHLVFFDYLRSYATPSGLVFTLTNKALEIITRES